MVVETTHTRGRTTPTQIIDRTGTTPTTGAGTTKAENPRYNYSDNYDSRRRLNRYRHQPRDPKNNIRFEYNAKDTDIYSTLRNTVDHLKEHPQADRHKFRKMFPKVTGHRNREEVREDTIAEIKLEDLQGVLKEDVDLIFDALVLHDYIEEVDA